MRSLSFLVVATLSTLTLSWAQETGHHAADAHAPAKHAADTHATATAPATTTHTTPAADHHGPSDSVAPDEAWKRLVAGNSRYVLGKAAHPHQDAARRGEIAQSQKPFAVVLTCADSRVAPEVLFDQGLGDIFVLRVAGNVANSDIQASIEYAVEHLGSTLIVVLGHERCGAVKAAMAGGTLPGHLPGLIKQITPAVQSARTQSGAEPLDLAINANAALAAEQLRTSEPLLQPLVKADRIKVIAARVDLDTGVVQALP